MLAGIPKACLGEWDEPQTEPKCKYIDCQHPEAISLTLRRAAPEISVLRAGPVSQGCPSAWDCAFSSCILNHSGGAESLIYDTLRAVAGGFFSLAFSLLRFFPPYPSPHPTKNCHGVLSIPLTIPCDRLACVRTELGAERIEGEGEGKRGKQKRNKGQ